MKPSHAEIRAYRERIQARFNLGITQAQDWCAKAVCASRRGWQRFDLNLDDDIPF